MSLVVAVLAVSAAALAQAPAPPAAEPQLPPQYEVEILVFENLNFDPTEERFEATPNGFADDAAALREVPVFDDTNFGPLAPLNVAPLPPVDPLAAQLAEALRIRPLRPEELKLGNEFAKLRASAAYRPLVHAGWVQPGLPETDAEPFDLKVLGLLNPRGTIRVHLSRFLHITLDLTYRSRWDVRAWGHSRRWSRRARARAALPLGRGAQRAQQRAALLRPSGVRSARASDAATGARRLGPPAGGLIWATREPPGPARRWRVRPQARAR